MFRPMRIIVIFDHEKDVMVTNSSPIRLIEGGRARLVRLASSHQVLMRGRKAWTPRANSIVRL